MQKAAFYKLKDRLLEINKYPLIRRNAAKVKILYF